MSSPIGLVVGTPLSPSMLAAIQQERHPRPEISLFLERNDVVLTTYADAAASSWRPVRMLREQRLHSWALAAAALRASRRCSGILASGEDVGLPLALLTLASNMDQSVSIIVHGSYLRSRKFRAVMALLRPMRRVRFLCLSESIRRTLIDNFGVPKQQAATTGYGADTKFFRPQGEPAAPPVIASAGSANRDYRTLVRAAALLGIRLEIAAGSAWFPTRADVTDDVLPHTVDVREYDYPSLRDLYARSAFVVVPLYPARHACGYAVIADAMAMGRAVIATRTASPSDFLVEGETGLYVEPGDADDLRRTILDLLSHPERAREMGQRGRERMESLYSVEAYCQRLEQAVRQQR
jgi:glycosyltransferase involved in cell wall biosynthesis